MKNRFAPTRLLAITLLGLLMAGCATYYPASRDSGVYYETPRYRTVGVAYVDPLVYPYWSLDYFYYSRYYHPYSVLVHRYDPWYYPYPGWYYGYWPGPRFSGHHGRFHYPWYRYGNPYAGYRPWYSGSHLSFGHYGRDRDRHRVREIDARLQLLETRQSLAVRGQRPERQLLPGAAPWLPATGRSAAARRDERVTVPRGGRGNDTGGRTSQRQALIERLRSGERSTRLPEREVRYGDGRDTRHDNRYDTRYDTRYDNRYDSRRPVAPPPTRDVRPRRSDNEPAPPSRRRTVEPRPPRSQPQRRQPIRKPPRPARSQSRPSRDEPSRRERR